MPTYFSFLIANSFLVQIRAAESQIHTGLIMVVICSEASDSPVSTLGVGVSEAVSSVEGKNSKNINEMVEKIKYRSTSELRCYVRVCMMRTGFA